MSTLSVTSLLTKPVRWYAERRINSWLEKDEDVEIILGRIIHLAEKWGKGKEDFKKGTDRVKSIFLKQPQGLALLRRIKENIHPNCRHKFFANFLIRASMIRPKSYYQYKQRYGIQPPYTILISPTMRCNLRCVGCYAGEYSRENDLPFEIVNKVIREGKGIGTLFYTILGGEPFVWEPLWDMFALHPDAYFQVYTNGTLIGEREARKLQKAGNVIINFSVEGFKGFTDTRRGGGVFDKVMKAMDLLHKYRVPFAFSCCVTRENIKQITSHEFIDLMVEKGCLIGWYFLYMPVGREANTNLMPTPAQRLYLKERRDYIRANKPIFIIDFWNDAPYVGGCIAGGRYFVHINSNGDVEPCIFIHLSTDNIKEKPLAEALNSPYFREMRARQPFNKNLFLPCQIIDNPEVLKDLYETYQPYSTHPEAEQVVTKFHSCLLEYSREVAELYKTEWEAEPYKNYKEASKQKGKPG